jgi:NhaA family Na+:H+ antiporter
VLTLGIGDASIQLDIQHWINDGLMTVFFFVVGLEIKRELVTGELRDRRAAMVPVVAAIGGMVLPAAIFLAFNAGTDAADGWAVPIATDIALALGVLALLGDAIPRGLRLFLLTLAIADDIGAIVVIALFYAHGVEEAWLAASVGICALLAIMRRFVTAPVAYVVPAVVLWVCVYESGVHATIAGVALGLLTPAVPIRGRTVLPGIERMLHPVSSFVVVPLFALANAGVVLSRRGIADAFSSRVGWGIIAGLVLGKSLGVFGATAIAVRLRLGRLPGDIRLPAVAGVAVLAGIGFTVSLFVANLSFAGAELDFAKIAVLAASCLAGIGGAVAVRVTSPRH